MKLKPNDAEAQNNLGAVWLDTGQARLAEACFCRALELVPEFADAHANLGAARYTLKQYDTAVESLHRAI